MSFEYIIISVSDERKSNMIKQIQDLKLKAPYTFLPNPATLSTISDYVKDSKDIRDDFLKRNLCCTISHFRAIEYGCKYVGSDFIVILEDDILIHKTQFENGIKEIIANWDSCIAPDKIASIGWIPCNNYSNYISVQSKHVLKCILGSKIVHDRFVPGLQAYIIRKQDFLPRLTELIHPTHESFRAFVRDAKYPDMNYSENDLIAADSTLNRMYGQGVLFPPLAIEQETESIIGHANTEKYWKPFFKEYDVIRDDYYSLS